MVQNPKSVTINLLTYNGQKYLTACLDSIFNQTHPQIKVQIIDNNSSDSTKEILAFWQKRYPQILIIYSQSNLGFAQAHNQLIELAKTEYICCLNQDVVLDQNFIANALICFDQDDKIASVQGKLYRLSEDNKKQKIIDTTGLLMLKNRRIISRGQGQVDQGQYEKQQEVFGADGAAPIYRKTALDDAKIANQYFDSDFFMYKEDVDLAWRLRLLGYKAVYQPKAVVWHVRSAGESAALDYLGIIKERLKISQFSKYLSFKNQRLMQIKNEQVKVLLRHILFWLPKEIGSWIYILLFEKYTLKAIKTLVKQMPAAWRKRKQIMARKTISANQMAKWFY